MNNTNTTKYCICIAVDDEMSDVGSADNLSPSLCTSFYEYELPSNVDSRTVVLVGRGILFEHDWCLQDSMTSVLAWDSSRNRWIPLGE